MALPQKYQSNAIKEVTTPSFYGSHQSMVVKQLDNGMVVCKDDIGEYTTFADRLDTGLADPKRWSRN